MEYILGVLLVLLLLYYHANSTLELRPPPFYPQPEDQEEQW